MVCHRAMQLNIQPSASFRATRSLSQNLSIIARQHSLDGASAEAPPKEPPMMGGRALSRSYSLSKGAEVAMPVLGRSSSLRPSASMRRSSLMDAAMLAVNAGADVQSKVNMNAIYLGFI